MLLVYPIFTYLESNQREFSKRSFAVIITNVASAAIAQLVERIHGKDEVSGSSPDRGSIDENKTVRLGTVFYIRELLLTCA